jgi:hypothetical protein
MEQPPRHIDIEFAKRLGNLFIDWNDNPSIIEVDVPLPLRAGTAIQIIIKDELMPSTPQRLIVAETLDEQVVLGLSKELAIYKEKMDRGIGGSGGMKELLARMASCWIYLHATQIRLHILSTYSGNRRADNTVSSRPQEQAIHTRRIMETPSTELVRLLEVWEKFSGNMLDRFPEDRKRDDLKDGAYRSYQYLPPRLCIDDKIMNGASSDQELIAEANNFNDIAHPGLKLTTEPNSLAKDEDSWKLVFDGAMYKIIHHVDGMHYIAQCLSAVKGDWLDPADMMLLAGRVPQYDRSATEDEKNMSAGNDLSIRDGFDRNDGPDDTSEANFRRQLKKLKKEASEIKVACSERPGNEMLTSERVRLEEIASEKEQLDAQMATAAKRRSGGSKQSSAQTKNVQTVWAGIKVPFKRISEQDAGKFEDYFKKCLKRQSYKFQFRQHEEDAPEWVVDLGDGCSNGSGRSG